MYFRRLDADLDLGRINDMLVGILKRLPNLKHVGIRAPREITGLEGMDPVFSWQDLYGAFPRSCGLNRPSYIFRWNEVNHQAPCMKFRGILKAIDTVQPKLDCFEITGFSNTVWQSFFAPPVQVAKGMSLMATLRNVTTLVLEFSLHNFEADTAVPARALRHVISTIRGNANLQNLTLSLAPHTDPVFLDPGWAAEIWRPVLKFLATSSPFRLRSLELRGITAATAHTLDDVIRTHSATLRRLVLDTASFRAPNSLHAFFSSLAHSNVEFLSLREIALNGYLMLEMRIVSMRPLQYDDGLDWEQGGDMDLCKDESYRDWIEITLDNSGDLGTMTWDYEGKRYIEGAMMEAMTQVVRMVEDGTIEEV
ncbi:hypothetical protein P153DRAFT_68739 [Dothidotthia symphoricarpi CBS 119687]|uniref:F-box domain-containing protein n=1 Tax=Dothidotthia symphoricarpi CBS 119687 TaxID=1392245 RepID=A0A6A6A5A6_9PLEO|nr:uncharacterized protein P153DRAFT_68739 [Dothidotthia symphoricarpi CBS 119687]KAF2126726.1 hypothetical protein P153DRAFT_68739 [Dothidotthia symphoricarpi CBS 119687]